MRMTAPGLLHREARRNAPRRRLLVGTRRRVRLSSVVDTEIGARLYGDMCGAHLIGSPGFVFGGDLLAAMGLRPFSFSPKSRERRLATVAWQMRASYEVIILYFVAGAVQVSHDA